MKNFTRFLTLFIVVSLSQVFPQTQQELSQSLRIQPTPPLSGGVRQQSGSPLSRQHDLLRRLVLNRDPGVIRELFEPTYPAPLGLGTTQNADRLVQGIFPRVSAQESSLRPRNLHEPNGDVSRAWDAHFGYDLVSALDAASAITHDNNGNIYVIGDNCLILKYDRAGNEKWRIRSLNGLSTGIAVDSIGNVYMACAVYKEGIGYDNLTTVKYDSNGVEQWTAVYISPQSDSTIRYSTYPYFISVDHNSNIYVTGSAGGTKMVLKYNSLGVQQWVIPTGMTGPYPANYTTQDIIVDDSSNVFVMGTQLSPVTKLDYRIVRYDSSGIQQWSTLYSGSGDSTNDIPYSFTIDQIGNIYVTGSSYSSKSLYDIATVRFNPDGTLRWVERFTSSGKRWELGTAVAVHNSKDVYVNGYTEAGSDNRNITIKYDSAGQKQWEARCDGWLGSLALTPTGDVCAITISPGGYLTVQYDQNGSQEWLRYYNGAAQGPSYVEALTVDGTGNVAVTGTSYNPYSGNDIATVEYDPQGTQRWSVIYDGRYNSGVLGGIAVGSDGSPYVTVSSVGGGYIGSRFYTFKYTTSGNQEWIAVNDRIYNPYDNIPWNAATAIATGASGRVYVSGSSGGFFQTVAYEASGAQVWIDTVWASGTRPVSVTGIAVDQSENVYITGNNFLLVKYNSSGIQEWVSRYDGSINEYDQVNGITVDKHGNVYITGSSSYGTDGATYTTVKFNPSGTQQWANRFPALITHVASATAIAIDDSDNVYVTGVSDNDYLTVKYSSQGVQEWVARYDGLLSSIDEATAIALDDQGNIYVTGRSVGVDSTYDVATLKYSPEGIQEWVARYSGGTHVDDRGIKMLVDHKGVYLTGTSTTVGSLREMVTIKYDLSGILEWIDRYNATEGSDDIPVGIAKDSFGNIFVGGISSLPATNISYGGPIYTLIKYFQIPECILSDTSLVFGDIDLSCSSIKNVRIVNPGSGTLILSSIHSDDMNFTPGASHIIIPSKDSTDLAIRFAPIIMGQKTGRILLTHNATGSPSLIHVMGYGVGDGSEIIVQNSYRQGWQLISLPLITRCPFIDPDLFLFDGGYLHRDTMTTGEGYWKKFLETAEVTLTGLALSADTIPLKEGWNLVGSISVSVLVNSLQTSPPGIITSFVFGFQGGYDNVDTIQPGRAYWLKTNQVGELILKQATENILFDNMKKTLAQEGSIWIKDANGNDRRLYIGMEYPAGQTARRYELPPTPPEGAFDVRFASNHLFEKIEATKEYPIIFSSVHYPMTIRWDFPFQDGDALLKIDDHIVRMGISGTLSVKEPISKCILIVNGLHNIPDHYALEQNYPNPFNPTTTIRYQLPVDSRVTLEIFDLLGQRIHVVERGIESAGYKSIEWNSSGFATGVYFYRMEAVSISNPGFNFTRVKKMLLLK